MSVTLSDEQQELRAVVRDFLATHSDESRVRALMGREPGYDPAVWRRLAGELGLVGLAVPEELGGAGSGWVEVGVVLEEAGGALLCAPLLSTAGIALPVLLAADPDVAKEYLPAVAAGELVATLALTEPGGRRDLLDVSTTAERTAAGWRVSGAKAYVPDGAVAGLLLVVAAAPDGIGVFAVDAGAEGLTATPRATLDQTRPLAGLELHGVAARPVLLEGPDAPLLRQALDRATIAVAADQVGGAQRALELAVGYAKTRHQFGRAIGSFQAIKHMCADMLLKVESGRSAVYHALEVAQESTGDAAERAAELAVAASLAKAYCSDAFLAVAKGSVQVHGGIGITWEHAAHLYLKRATSTAQLLGDAAWHRARFAERVIA
jgi:alkylation response protein AidB-like acyl-CoA dehydrogenase